MMRDSVSLIILSLFIFVLSFADLAQARDDLFDEPVRRRSSGCDADARSVAQVFRIDLVRRLDEKTFLALLLADREELQAVRRVLAADDVEGFDVSGERARRVLPVARRGADGVDDLRLAVGSLANGVGDFE